MRRADFRKKIDAELKRMGFKPSSWIWQNAPARLMICLNGEFKDIPIKANMKKEDLARQLGRLEGWAEMLGYVPVTELKPAPATRRQPRQIDLEEAIAGVSA